MVKGVGAVRMRQLLEFFGSAEIAWNAPAEGLISAGLPNKVVENFLLMRDEDRPGARNGDTGNQRDHSSDH